MRKIALAYELQNRRTMGDLRGWVLVAMILGGSFIAGCCGGPGNESGCMACEEQAAEAGPKSCDEPGDAGTDASDSGTSD